MDTSLRFFMSHRCPEDQPGALTKFLHAVDWRDMEETLWQVQLNGRFHADCPTVLSVQRCSGQVLYQLCFWNASVVNEHDSMVWCHLPHLEKHLKLAILVSAMFTKESYGATCSVKSQSEI